MQPTRRLFGWLSRNRNDRLRSAKDNRSYSRFCWTTLLGTAQGVLDPNEEPTKKKEGSRGWAFWEGFLLASLLVVCNLCAHLQKRIPSATDDQFCLCVYVCVCLFGVFGRFVHSIIFHSSVPNAPAGASLLTPTRMFKRMAQKMPKNMAPVQGLEPSRIWSKKRKKGRSWEMGLCM